MLNRFRDLRATIPGFEPVTVTREDMPQLSDIPAAVIGDRLVLSGTPVPEKKGVPMLNRTEKDSAFRNAPLAVASYAGEVVRPTIMQPKPNHGNKFGRRA